MSHSASMSFSWRFPPLYFLHGLIEPRPRENRATGVAFVPNPLFHPDGPTEMRTVRGTKLVVISSGSLGTPGILERSGIGAKEVLEGVGVKQRVDLPGVGENYQGPLRDELSVTWAMLLTPGNAQTTTIFSFRTSLQTRRRRSMRSTPTMQKRSRACTLLSDYGQGLK